MGNEDTYSAEINLDRYGIVKSVKLNGNRENLWKKIIDINLKHLEFPARNISMENEEKN